MLYIINFEQLLNIRNNYMPANKNAVIRYKILDQLLKDRHHYYNMVEITEKVNDELEFLGYLPVTKRALEKDICYLQEEPFNAEIERFKHDGKHCVKYRKRNYSIFHKDLTDEEEALICEALNTIGQFEGLPNFNWLDDLQADFSIKRRDKVMLFSKNTRLRHKELLASLFECTSNKQVITLHYKRFTSKEEDVYEFHPYILKQYNDRWYLVGWRPSDNEICTLPIDRIETFEPNMTKKFLPYSGDIEKYFDDVVGITVYKDAPVEDVYLWVSNHEYSYISTKPIHNSQEFIGRETDEGKMLTAKYPQVGPFGYFARLRCKQNFELERELCSHFGGVIVLEPKSLKESIASKISEMNEKYSLL